jgi:transcription elongation factor GreA
MKNFEVINLKEKTYLTEQGLNELKAELDELKNVRRPENIQALKEARALGDLSENAEYDAARNEQAVIEGRIQELEAMLENVEVITEVSTDKVSIGVKVKIEFVDDKETDVYSIVGTKEADPFENKISNESPIAKAIMGKKVGEVATVETETSSYDVKILEISAQ